MNADLNRTRKGTGNLAVTFHEALLLTLKANPSWEYPFALGYVSGKFDANDKRPREHKTSETDDYAKGYHCSECTRAIEGYQPPSFNEDYGCMEY